ncbi:hypothetical protein BA059_14385 [Mycolicibacterium sp. (ex Dasyatis americana)]|uniref:Secreted protein n=2 Tax=Mycobacteriaceae TaxID=1762 RepID=A0A1Q9W437_9MYCO|nr:MULTISPECIES: hypothetical protein [Mycobacteriaceae]OFB38831.1 hypothetical protein BA059_14385 [Mycolicibacterium sp. (ex Dasyatis americana)]MCG7608023.1 hypothetical protein [Mycobacterium sp. CnD-18-1]OHT90864.1 hypothetical protein BKG61_26690 [Mycobacterium syngnathidarum]OLT88164.1 hypothetical protein BKG60_27955 [Mycobacterium syngnathidarum]QZH65465.1 hypothetical protein K6L26_26385 [Mycolicibacterium farcinogenes]
MLSRVVIGLVSAAGAAVMSVPPVAAAEPEPAPALPNVNAYPPVKTSEYAVMDNNWYAFSVPEGITCVLQRSGGYGCSGPIPAAPNGANLVSGGPGVPGFASSPAPVFAVVDNPKPLPPNSRISYQTISCGTDGVTTSCIDGRNQSGFVIGPAGSFVIGEQESDFKPTFQIG